MRFIDDQQEILGEVVEKTVGGRTRLAAVDMSGVVLDSRAGSNLPHHLDVIARAHTQSLGLELLALILELDETFLQFRLDSRDRALHTFGAGHVVGGREDVDFVVVGEYLSRHRVKRHQAFDLVAEHLDSNRVLLVHREHFHRVAADPKRPALEGDVVSCVLDIHETAQELIAFDLLAHTKAHHAVHVLLRSSQAVDRRHRCHHENIPTRE